MSDNYLNVWESDFKQFRPFLISFAFRMTGSLSEAEDLVQDTFLECARIPRSEINNPKSWLTKICTNKGIDHMKSAYKKRETYPGTWLPDAIPDSLQIWSSLQESESPEQSVIASESLTTSFLLLVERLSPEERAVYLLSEVFEYPFKEIAALLDKSEDACRKTAQRARAAISSAPKFVTDSVDSTSLIARFFEHAKNGNKLALEEMLSEESEFWSDGGGKVPAAMNILTGETRIAAFFAGLGTSNAFVPDNFKLDFTTVNSRTGLVISKRNASGLWSFDTVFSFEIRDNRIVRLYAQRNPDKLKALLRTL